MSMKEEWRPVVGYEGFYEVSNFGAVKSLPRRVPHYTGASFVRKGGDLKITITGLYPQVNLSKEGRTKTHMVHRLVAAAFLGARPKGFHVRHLDGDKWNASATNLAYGTAKQNMEDMARHGRVPKGVSHGRAKISEDDVRTIRKLKGLLTHKEIASTFGLGLSQVGNIIYGLQWKHVKD